MTVDAERDARMNLLAVKIENATETPSQNDLRAALPDPYAAAAADDADGGRHHVPGGGESASGPKIRAQ